MINCPTFTTSDCRLAAWRKIETKATSGQWFFEPMSQHHWIESAAMPHWPNAVSAGTKVPENENGKKCFTSFINLCPWPWLSTDIKNMTLTWYI